MCYTTQKQVTTLFTMTHTYSYTIHTLIHTVIQQLLPAYQHEEQAQRQAWYILGHITHKTQAQLHAYTHIELTCAQQNKLQEIIQAHVHNHMPLEYSIGSVDFLGLTLKLKPPILIPRPETEYWCAQLIEQLSKQTYSSLTDFYNADVCTGSGCIALAFAKYFPQAHVYALDTAEYACKLAQENAHNNSITNCTVIQSNLFSALDPALQFDLIVSNPPYISYNEWLTLDPSVKKWEAYEALVADNNGLAIIEQLLDQARTRLRTPQKFTDLVTPQLVLEIGHNQGEAVKNLCLQYGYTHVTIQQDLAGHDRVVTAVFVTTQ